MSEKKIILVDADFHKRALAAREKNLKTVQEDLAKIAGQRKQEIARVAALNAKTAAAVEGEITRIGIDLKKINAVCFDNAKQLAEDMKRFRESRTAAPLRPRIPAGLSPIPSPGHAQSEFRTPPYDFATDPKGPGVVFPANPQPASTVACPLACDATTGTMSYYMDTPIDSPNADNVYITMHLGIQFTPPTWASGQLWPFWGLANVQMTAALNMIGSASCSNFGGANSSGSIGWIIKEFNAATFEPTGVVYQSFAEQYYVNVNGSWFSGASGQQEGPPTLTSQTAFITWPERYYWVSVWLLGIIDAHGGGENNPWASQAAGSANVIVDSISVSWTPLWAP